MMVQQEQRNEACRRASHTGPARDACSESLPLCAPLAPAQLLEARLRELESKAPGLSEGSPSPNSQKALRSGIRTSRYL